MKDGWEMKKLGSICTFSSGGTPSKKNSSYWTGDIPWVSGRDMKSTRLFETVLHISQAAVDESSTRMAMAGDLLILVRGMGLAHGAQIGELMVSCAFNQDIRAIHTGDEVSSRYLLLALRTRINMSENVLSSAAHGTLKIDMQELRNIEIPLPSLVEQKRIVAILDEAFAAIDQAKVNAEKNLTNARELFESYLNQVFTQKGEGWEETTLGEVCKFSSGGTPSKKNLKFWGGEVPWVSGRDMKSTRISDTTLHITQLALKESSSAKMAGKGDLLILVRGMGLAHGAQIGELMVPSAFNQDIRAMKAKDDLVPRYLLFALKTRINLSDNVLSNAAHGTLKINSDELRAVDIPFPSRSEQERIVATIDSLSASTRKLEAIYSQKLTNLDELKQSLLQKAFTGKLTTKQTEQEVAL